MQYIYFIIYTGLLLICAGTTGLLNNMLLCCPDRTELIAMPVSMVFIFGFPAGLWLIQKKVKNVWTIYALCNLINYIFINGLSDTEKYCIAYENILTSVVFMSFTTILMYKAEKQNKNIIFAEKGIEKYTVKEIEDLQYMLEIEKHNRSNEIRAYNHDLRNILMVAIHYVSENTETAKNKVLELLRLSCSDTLPKEHNFNEILAKYDDKEISIQIIHKDSFKFYGSKQNMVRVIGNLVTNAKEAYAKSISFVIEVDKITIHDNGECLSMEFIQAWLKDERYTTKGGGVGIKSIKQLLKRCGLKIECNVECVDNYKFIIRRD